MTPDEFKRWWLDFGARFPSVGAWADKLADDCWQKLKADWVASLATVTYAEARQVTADMATGKVEAISTLTSDREALGRIVARIVADSRPKPARKPDASYMAKSRQSVRRQQADEFPAGEVFQFATRLRRSGRTKEDVRRIVAERWPVDTDSDRRSRVNCKVCRDSGHAIVWHDATLLAYRDSPDNVDVSTNRLTAAVRCTCRVGKSFPERGPDFAYSDYCLVPAEGVNDESAIGEFKAWAADFWERRARLEHMRHSDFDDWNEEEPY